MAAAVGVNSSPWVSVGVIGMPRSSSAAAGGGDGHDAVGTFDGTVADYRRRGVNLIDLKNFKSEAGGDDVNDGIDGTYFVKMHLFDSGIVDFGFGFGECGKNGDGLDGDAR